jgi:hypothetical protein
MNPVPGNQRLEDAMNRLADIDAGWWPFLRLRPVRHQFMDNARLLRMALYYGTLYGLLVFVWYLLIGYVALSPFAPLWAAACVLAFALYFFVACKFVVAACWNRRAARLQAAVQAGEPAPGP